MMFVQQPQQPVWRRPTPSTISRLCLIFVVVVTLSSSWLVGVTQCACSERATRRNRFSTKDDYGVLIDAGSTGTRVWVYSWPRDQDGDTEEPPGPTVPPIECRYTHKVSKGLAEYAEDLQTLRDIVVTLIGKAKSQVPEKLHGTTSIFLMATAGQSSSSPFDLHHPFYPVHLNHPINPHLSPFHCHPPHVSSSFFF